MAELTEKPKGYIGIDGKPLSGKRDDKMIEMIMRKGFRIERYHEISRIKAGLHPKGPRT